jgi:hypothetical protein
LIVVHNQFEKVSNLKNLKTFYQNKDHRPDDGFPASFNEASKKWIAGRQHNFNL